MRISDWSSDVCSSDLCEEDDGEGAHGDLRWHFGRVPLKSAARRAGARDKAVASLWAREGPGLSGLSVVAAVNALDLHRGMVVAEADGPHQIGSASGRERVGQYV